MPVIFFKGELKDWGYCQTVLLMWNLLTTGFIFVGAMMLYDPDGTIKPDWLDWFGRLDKWVRGA